MTNVSNSGKVKVYGNSRAVLSDILFSSNYPLAKTFAVFAFLHCYCDHKILKVYIFMIHFPSDTLVVFWARTHIHILIIIIITINYL